MNRNENKSDDRYMMIALMNMVLSRSKINCELFINGCNEICMEAFDENNLYRERGRIIKNKVLVRKVFNWLTVSNDGCYPRTDKETTLTVKRYVNSYLKN